MLGSSRKNKGVDMVRSLITATLLVSACASGTVSVDNPIAGGGRGGMSAGGGSGGSGAQATSRR